MLWAFLLMEIDIYEEPRYTGVNKNIPLPSNINTDKQAILDILHNHFLLAQIFWPGDDIISAKSISGTTMFTLRTRILHYITPSCREVQMNNHDDDVAILDKPDGGPEIEINYIVTETKGQSSEHQTLVHYKNEQLTVFTGYTLEERFWQDTPADGAFMSRFLFGVHQRHTLCLLRFFKGNTSADKQPSSNPTKLKKD